MLDKNYIAELESLGGKAAKEALSKYANDEFGIFIKKTKSFENMVLDLEEILRELSDEPMPEEDGGMTIYEMVNSDLGTEVAAEVSSQKVELSKTQPDPVEVQVVVKEEAPASQVTVALVPEPVKEEAPASQVEVGDLFELPPNYSPSLITLGRGNAQHVTLPWWIYDWITKNPDWKKHPDKFPHYYAIDTLKSLIYYIKRDGQVKIRETRNSRYFILK